MLKFKNNKIFLNEIPIILIEVSKGKLYCNLLQQKFEINKKEFNEFYKKYLLEFSDELIIKNDFFEKDEIESLENMGFKFLSTEYDIEKEKLVSFYLFKLKKIIYIKNEEIKDIIEKLDLN